MSSISIADNGMNAFGVFINRQDYDKNAILPESINRVIDLWYDRLLYGRVDNNNSSIILSEASLKQLGANTFTPLFAANFVVDAFNDLKKNFDRANSASRLTPNSKYSTLESTSGWKSMNSIYHTYVSTIYDNFISTFVKQNGRNEKISDFESFIHIFIEYVDIIATTFPLTKSSFIRSKYCAPETSGLVIDLSQTNFDDDKDKTETFIKDPNFQFFIKSAKKFGFLVDKNAPWRLVADVTSTPMKGYQKKYNITSLDELFDTLYYQSFSIDLDSFKTYVIQFYNSLVTSDPFVFLPKQAEKCRSKTIIEKYQRQPVSQDIYDYQFWNKLYIYVRAREASLLFNQPEFNSFYNTTNEIEKSVDTQTAREYLNRRLVNLPNNVISVNTIINKKESINKVGNPNNVINKFSFY